MNISKINQYFLKQVLQGNDPVFTRWTNETENVYLLNENQSVIFILPQNDFHIKLNENGFKDLTPLVKQLKYCEEHIYRFDLLEYIEDIVRNKMTLHHFQSVRGYHIYIDKKNLDLFKDRYSKFDYYIDTDKSGLVYILEDDKVIGGILTVKLKEVKND